MPKKKKESKYDRIYYADFETTSLSNSNSNPLSNLSSLSNTTLLTPLEPQNNNKVRVYLWVVLRGEEVYYGDSIETFIDLCRGMKKCIMYFHNVKFDFSYIQYYLIKNEIEYSILENKGVLYSIKLFNIEIRDSLNFLNMSLAEVGNNYCTQYHKTSIDYNVPFDHTPTEEEIAYCINDCRVLEEGLSNYLSEIKSVLITSNAVESSEKVYKKLTNAGIAYEAFKEMSSMERMCIKTTYTDYQRFKYAYKGGYVYSRPCGIVEDVQMIDCNSMYPTMYSQRPLPFGHYFACNTFEELEKYPFYIMSVTIKYELKSGYIPIIGGGVGKYGGTEYKASSNGEYEELIICNIDFDLIKRFYDCDYTLNWGYAWYTKDGMFKEYCDIFIQIKKESKGIRRNVAKMFLNSPYGKTAMNGLQEIKKYYIDEHLGIVKNTVVGYELDESLFQYLPLAIAITAYARHYLLTTAEEVGFENIYYMDTDSIKFKYKPTSIKYDPKELGAWKDEGRVALFKTIAPKRYIYWTEEDERLHITCAGFGKRDLKQFADYDSNVPRETALDLMQKFSPGLELWCLQSHIAPGGRALIPVLKKMK